MDTSVTGSETSYVELSSENDSVQERWKELLLKWLNKCVHPDNTVNNLNKASFLEIMNKYKGDIYEVVPEMDLSLDDIVPLIRHNYPLFKLSHIADHDTKIYLMTSVLLYHCCVSSIDGVVDNDICAHLDQTEQENILRFCEKLSDFPITCDNVDVAIEYACKPKSKTYEKLRTLSMGDSGEAHVLTSKDAHCSQFSSSSVVPAISSVFLATTTKRRNIRFNTSVTVLDSDTNKKPSDSNHKNISPITRMTTDNMDTQVNSGSQFLKDFVVQASSTDLKQKKQSFAIGPPRLFPVKMSTSSSKDDKEKDDKEKDDKDKDDKDSYNPRPISGWLKLAMISLLLIGIVITAIIKPWNSKVRSRRASDITIVHRSETSSETVKIYNKDFYICRNSMCQRTFGNAAEKPFGSLSRCILQCMGPQIWPKPVGFTHFSDKIVAMATSKLEYKFQSIPSQPVNSYLTQAFKLFLADLGRLEGLEVARKQANTTEELFPRKMSIQIDIESDPDPRIRLNTDETYQLNIDVVDGVVTINIASPSFCGARHGLETLSQLILLDQSTGYLITLSHIVIKDAPTYKYRGLMIDTAKNYIPISDLTRTIDAMASCKLNTFHWRISDAASFPLLLPSIPQLFEYGGYDRSLVYTKEHVKAIVERARVRGIRVLLEIAAPGPVGRAWAWTSEAFCPRTSTNFTCDNVLCLRLSMSEDIMEVLQVIYAEIIEMTNVDDVFHLSDGLFEMIGCYYLLESREGFLEKALHQLRLANSGVLPTLPIIWYTDHLAKASETRSWERLGVQMTAWISNLADPYLSKYKVIQSSRWDLSCEIRKQRCIRYRTWQSMYGWTSWREVGAFSIEGGEAILWTDLVDSGNLDLHLWPRTAAVAERLWSDVAINSTADPYVYIRLDSHRWRMLLKSVKVQPIWPVFCSYNPDKCLRQIPQPQP